MTKKHFEIMAKLIREDTPLHVDVLMCSGIDTEMRRHIETLPTRQRAIIIASAFVHLAEMTSQTFDVNRFLGACSLTETPDVKPRRLRGKRGPQSAS